MEKISEMFQTLANRIEDSIYTKLEERFSGNRLSETFDISSPVQTRPPKERVSDFYDAKPITVTQKVPDFSPVLNELDSLHVFNFVRAAKIYRHSYAATLHIQSSVTMDVMNTVIQRNPAYDMESIQSLTFDEFTKMLWKIVAPRNSDRFLNAFTKIVEHLVAGAMSVKGTVDVAAYCEQYEKINLVVSSARSAYTDLASVCQEVNIPNSKPTRVRPGASLVEHFEILAGKFFSGMMYAWNDKLIQASKSNFLQYLSAVQEVNQDLYNNVLHADRYLMYVSKHNALQTSVSKPFPPRVQNVECGESMNEIPFNDVETCYDSDGTLHGVSFSQKQVLTRSAEAGPCYAKFNSTTLRCPHSACTYDHSRESMWKICLENCHKAAKHGFQVHATPPSDFNTSRKDSVTPVRNKHLVHFVEHDAELSAMLATLETVPLVYRTAETFLGNECVSLQVLLDSGATHESYVNTDTVARLMRYPVSPTLEFLDRPSSVTLADGVTKYSIDSVLVLPLKFLGTNDKIYEATVRLKVLPLQGKLDAIIGLPHLCGPFYDLFLEVLTANRIQLEQNSISAFVQSVSLLPNEFNSGNYELIEKVWDTNLSDNIADEEVNIPMFGESLHFVASRTFAEHKSSFLQCYHNMFPPELLHSAQAPECVQQFQRYLEDYGFRAFQPQEHGWSGIKNVKIDIDWSSELPTSIPCKARPVPKRLEEPLRDYIENLRNYFWVPSDSLIATPLVIAPKATAPFIRVVGAYNHTVNKYMHLPSWYIPNARDQIQNLAGAQFFGNADVTRAFHQLTLSEDSSKKLTVCTPYGNFRPLGVPEGVIGGSHYLQQTMSTILHSCTDFCLVLYDNLFFYADSLEQFFDNFKKILNLCIEHNVILNVSKTSFSQREVIFGMLVTPGKYEFDPARLDGIRNLGFPSNVKEVRSLLGTLNFLADFCPRYSDIAAPIFDMSKATFNWDESTWTRDYRAEFEKLKYACTETLVQLSFPDYTRKWLTYSDASNVAVCGIIVMFDEQDRQLPLAIYSRKLTSVAQRWPVIQKEAYALYNTYKCGKNLLLGKEHMCLTDHANLLQIEKSTRPMIQNIVAYLQQFAITKIVHVPGPVNPADGLTRAPFLTHLHVPDILQPCDSIILNNIRSSLAAANFTSEDIDDAINTLALASTTIFDSYEDAQQSLGRKEAEEAVAYLTNIIPEEEFEHVLKQVHNARVGHWGYAKTKSILDTEYPGHSIPDRVIQMYLLGCHICQKHRRFATPAVVPFVKSHNNFPMDSEAHRYIVSVDFLKLPKTTSGNVGMSVFVNHFSKRVKMYPQTDNSAPALAASFLSFYAHQGAFAYVLSDLGTDLMGQTFQIFREYLGKENQLLIHLNTLAYRPMAHGTEPTNKKIINRLRDLINDPTFGLEWDDKITLALVEILINFNRNRETNAIPIAVDTGDPDIYFNLPSHIAELPETKTADFTVMVRNRFKHIRDILKKNHEYALETKSKKNNLEPRELLQPGDFVLHNDHKLSNKLRLPREGPFEVISHEANSNKVIIRSLIDGVYTPVFSGNLSRFVGDREQAIKAAKLDDQTHQIIQIFGYKGDLEVRSSLQFYVLLANNNVEWIPFCIEITRTTPYNDFADLHSEFYLMDAMVKERNMRIKQMNSRTINIKIGTVCFVNLRSWSEDWYQELSFPDYEDKYKFQFMVKGIYGKVCGTLKKPRIEITFPVLEEYFIGSNAVDNRFVQLYGSNFKWKTSWILVDEQFVFTNPSILDVNIRDRVLLKLKKRFESGIRR